MVREASPRMRAANGWVTSTDCIFPNGIRSDLRVMKVRLIRISVSSIRNRVVRHSRNPTPMLMRKTPTKIARRTIRFLGRKVSAVSSFLLAMSPICFTTKTRTATMTSQPRTRGVAQCGRCSTSVRSGPVGGVCAARGPVDVLVGSTFGAA